jgi:integrase
MPKGKVIMAKRVKEKLLDSKDARQRLKIQGKPHWRSIERGLHLGYRRLKDKAGTWVARHYVGEKGKPYIEEQIGIADDLSDADGIKMLSYWQAVDAARARMAALARAAAGIPAGPYTVKDAIDNYVDHLSLHKRSGRDVAWRATAHITPALGAIEVASLTTDLIRKWHAKLAKSPARIRTKNGAAQRYRICNGNEDERRRRVSANRSLSQLKAALNRARAEGEVHCDDSAWKLVKPFAGVDTARIRYLSIAEGKRLINTCDPDFRLLVRAALETGARYSELARLEVADFNPDSGTLAIRQSKTGKTRHVILTPDGGVPFFKQACAGRPGSAIMFPKADGTMWRKSHQDAPMRAACRIAKIEPHVGFHQLRHTWASHAVMGGVPLLIVARNLGHSDTRMVERHYGHLNDDYVVKAIHAGAPRFGEVASNVKVIR